MYLYSTSTYLHPDRGQEGWKGTFETAVVHASSFFLQGCYQAVINWVMSHVDIIIGVGIGLALLQLFGIFLAFCLTKNINSYIK